MTEQDPWLTQFEARRKERADKDRSFILGGETLTVRPSVAPEVGLRRGEFEARIAKFQIDVAEAEKAGKPQPELGVSDQELLDLAEGIIMDCLDPDSYDAWLRLRSPDNPDPLSLMDIYGLSGYVLSRVVRLPTDGPSASSDGPQTNGRNSKAASTSRAATRKR